jgi:SH3-like domain-containing protein
MALRSVPRFVFPVLVALAAGAAQAQGTGLPVPRFVTLRSDEVNLRTGPGSRYPIEWVYSRRGLPVEVVAEFDTWRRIRDVEGIEGWVHQSLLAGRRGLIVEGPDNRAVRAEPDDRAELVAWAEPGAIGSLLRCPALGDEAAWCYVEFDGYRGWIGRDSIWGVYPGEEVD